MDSIIGFFLKREPTAPRGPGVTYGEANVRPVEPIAGQDAPDPVRQSDTLARPARWPKAIFTNIPGIKAVMFDEFAFPLFAPEPHAHYLIGPGSQLSWDERNNIRMPRSEPYGSEFEVVGNSPDYAGVYAKILT